MRRFALVLVVLLAVACGLAAAQAPADKASEQERLATWRKQRVTELTADDGWLTLVGLHWLRDGVNRAGSAPDANLPLPSTAPASLGTFALVGGRVTFAASTGSTVTVDGKAFDKGD